MAAKAIKGRNIIDNIEKILISLIFISILGYYFITGERELKTTYVFPIVLLLETLLLGYYIYITRNLFSLFLVGFIIWNIGFYVMPTNYSIGKKLIQVGEFSQLVLGFYLGYKTILESKKNKDWEMFGTLTTLLLMFPVIFRYFLSGKEMMVIYHYALPFLIGIIIYNENLWDKYLEPEKKILTYVLVAAVAEVLFISLKLV